MAFGVTNAGFAKVADLIKTTFTHLALGTGTTAFAVAQTALVSEITDSGLQRAAGTNTRVTTTVTNDTAQSTKTWTASGSKAVAESGWFDAGAGGNMLIRDHWSTTRNVVSGDTVAWTAKCVCA